MDEIYKNLMASIDAASKAVADMRSIAERMAGERGTYCDGKKCRVRMNCRRYVSGLLIGDHEPNAPIVFYTSEHTGETCELYQPIKDKKK